MLASRLRPFAAAATVALLGFAGARGSAQGAPRRPALVETRDAAVVDRDELVFTCTP